MTGSSISTRSISLVVPCFNEQEAIPIFYDAVQQVSRDVADEFTLQVIFVDDGSTDNSLAEIRELAGRDPGVTYVSFSRNFGKDAAILAGLETSTSDYTVVIDADLQHPVELIPQMYALAEAENLDCVGTIRSRTGEPRLRSWFSRLFYSIINRFSDVEIIRDASDYRLMSRRFVAAVISLKETNRFSREMFNYVGFRTRYINYVNQPRAAGATKWSFGQLWLYAIDGIVNFSTVPLVLSSLFGVLFFVVAMIVSVWITVRWMIWGDPVAGWPSLVVLILFVSGIQLFSISIVGQYLGKTYLEAKKRPIYIVQETG